MSYRKRAKGSWNCGKDYKKDSNRSERIYEKQEIREELEEYEQGEDFRYKYHRVKPKSQVEKVESQIRWYEKALRRWKDYFDNNDDNYFTRYVKSLKSRLKRLETKKKNLTTKK